MPAATRITEPGIYRGFDIDAYFADPCPSASFTQGLGKLLLQRSPLHAWYGHPKLNPDFERDDDTKYDVGNVAHALMIGRGKNIVVLDYDDWRTKAAREAREAAAAIGQLAVLRKTFTRAERIVRAGREQLDNRALAHLFTSCGDGEVVIAWKERAFWCRQMLDWLSTDSLIYADYKTTDQSAAPMGLGRLMTTAGWDVQAAMAERGLNAVSRTARRRFLFVVQEADAPYCLNVVELSESVLTMGRKKLAVAMSIWSKCVRENRWPGYPAEIVVPEYPAWAEAEWLAREELEFSDNVLMAG